MPNEPDYTEWDKMDRIKLAIAAHFWKDLPHTGNQVLPDSPAYSFFQWLKQEVDKLKLLGKNAGFSKGYSLVLRADLKKIAESLGQRPPFLYPEERKTIASGKNTIKAAKQCRAWLIDLMTNGDPTKTKRSYQSDAQAKFDVSGLSFKRAWADAIAETGNGAWRKPGPKSKH